jgi:hypothetical protein
MSRRKTTVKPPPTMVCEPTPEMLERMRGKGPGWGVSGIDWGDLKEFRIPRWPSKIGEKRPLVVEITSWVGISAGARHYYAHIKEHEQCWWDNEDNRWAVVSGEDSRDFKVDVDAPRREAAIKIAKAVVKAILSLDDPEAGIEHSVEWRREA